MTPSSPVLLAEDRPDWEVLCQLLDKAGVKNPLVALTDGEKLSKFLKAILSTSPRKSGSLRPCLIFLDVTLPKIDGFEMLRWIRQQGALKDLPVILLADTIEPRDVKRAAALNVTRFLARRSAPRILAEIIAGVAKGR